MAQACSVEASRLAPEDAAGYKTKRKDSTRLAFVEFRLRDAKAERQAIIAEVQRMYPGLVNSNGEFLEDLRAQEIEAQLSMFTKKDKGGTASVRAALSRRSAADPVAVEADDKAAAQRKSAKSLGRKTATIQQTSSDPDGKDTFVVTLPTGVTTELVRYSSPGKVDEWYHAESDTLFPARTEQDAAARVQDDMEFREYLDLQAQMQYGNLPPALVDRYLELGRKYGTAEEQTRSAQRSATEVPSGKQPGGSSEAGSGTPTKRKNPLSGKGRKAADADKKETPSPKKPSEEATESERTGETQPQQAERQEQQQADVVYKSASQAWDSVRQQVLLGTDPAYNTILTWKELKAGGAFADTIKAWEQAFKDGKADIATLEAVYADAVTKGKALLDTAVDLITTAKDREDFTRGASMLYRATIFRDAGEKMNAWRNEAMTYVNGTADGDPLYDTADHALWAKEAFLELAAENIKPTISTAKNGDRIVKNPSYTDRNGDEKPWVSVALDNGWLIETIGRLDVPPINPSDDVKAQFGDEDIDTAVRQIVLEAEEEKALTEAAEAATEQVMNMLDKILGGTEITDSAKKFYATAFRTSIKEGADMTMMYRGARLNKWLPNGQPQWDDQNKLIRPAKSEPTVGDVVESLDAPISEGRASVNGSAVTKPLSMLQVKSYIQKVVKRLRKAPTIRYYKNLEQFKEKNPDWYQEAMTSRKDRRGIPANAAGYSFGNKVVIFQEQIRSKQHLAFVIAHEVYGHHGLAAYMSPHNLKRLMNEIYDTDPYIRAMADQRIEVEGMDKTEAVEEALADYAGQAEASTIIRVWNAIKTFLNKLNFNFSDDMARYWVAQSRRLVRTGTTGDLTALGIHEDLKGIQARSIEGRASANLAGVHADALGGMGQGSLFRAWQTGERAMDRADDVVRMLARGLEAVQSLDQKALRNEGLKLVFDLFERQTAHIRGLQTRLNDKLQFSHRFNAMDWVTLGKFSTVEDPDDFSAAAPPPTKAERAEANRLLQWASLYRAPKVDDALIRKQGDLIYVDDNGIVRRNQKNIDAVIKEGEVTKAEFERGLKVPKMNDDGTESGEYETITFGKVSGRVWKLYSEQRAAVNEAAIMVYEDKVRGMMGAREAEFAQIQRNYDLPSEVMDILKTVSLAYDGLYKENAKLQGKGFKWDEKSIARSKQFVHHVLRVMDKDNGNKKLKDWLNGPALDKDGKLVNEKEDGGMLEFRQDQQLMKLITPHLITLNKHKIDNAMSIRNTIMDMMLLDSQLTNAQYAAMNTILSSYVPLVRRGAYQVRVEAYDPKTGERVPITDEVKALLYYSRTNSKSEANSKRDELNALFEQFDKDNTEVTVFGEGTKDKDGTLVLPKKKGVAFRAVSETAKTAPPMGETVNYDAMVNTLLQAGIVLREKDRKTLVEMTTKQHSTARARLRRRGNPGWDENIMQGIAEHLETQTHVAGKNRYRHRLARIMADKVGKGSVWFGTKGKLDRLQTAYATALRSGNESAQIRAYRELAEYQHMFVESSSNQGIDIMDRAGNITKVDGKGKGNQYQNTASELMNYYDSSMNIVDNTGEDVIGRAAGPMMSLTAAMQLGGALAPALINTTSLVSHAIPYLSTRNKKTGYGGGFGMAKASAAIMRASRDLSLIKDGPFKDVVGDAAVLKDLIQKHKWDKEPLLYGMKKDEAVLIQSLTEKGVLTPNMFNALIGTSRTGKQDQALPRATEKWMLLFSKTEQFNRRVTALAAYRLEKERMIEAGTPASAFNNMNSEASREAYSRAVRAVDASQGNYSQFNRPHWARGNVLQYLYMYKQFVVITVQLMRNLAPKERMILLGFLLLVSGVKGFPFAEDLMDLIDTLMQMFGIPWEGVEANMQQLVADIVPGTKYDAMAARIVMRGLLDYAFGTTVSTRLGHGNIVPGTSMFLAGANTAREATDVLGPVASAMTGTAAAIAMATKYAAEVVGIREDTTSLADVLRTGGGFTALKAMTEGLVFYADGEITNDRGQVVAKDFGVIDMITRMIGFYPGDATTQYDVERMASRAKEYAKEIKMGFTIAYRKADSSAERNAILRAVREFNRDVGRSSPFYMRNFAQSANKSKREADRTATQRSLKAAPTAAKDFQKQMMVLNGLDVR